MNQWAFAAVFGPKSGEAKWNETCLCLTVIPAKTLEAAQRAFDSRAAGMAKQHNCRVWSACQHFAGPAEPVVSNHLAGTLKAGVMADNEVRALEGDGGMGVESLRPA